MPDKPEDRSAAARAEREARALRENLRRRKEQARRRAAAVDVGEADAGTEALPSPLTRSDGPENNETG